MVAPEEAIGGHLNTGLEFSVSTSHVRHLDKPASLTGPCALVRLGRKVGLKGGVFFDDSGKEVTHGSYQSTEMRTESR